MRRISPASIPQALATVSGVKPRTSSRSSPSPFRCSLQLCRALEALLDDRARNRGEQQRVGARPDEVVLARLVGGAGAARVDHHDLAAALADGANPPAHVGRGEQAAVRDERVGAEHQQVVAAVHVRHRDREDRAEHLPGGDLLRHLVDRRGGVDVLRAERPQPDRPVHERRQVVRVRVAHVDGHGVPAVLVEDRREPALDLLERLLPAGLDQLAVAAHQRGGQPVRVLVELLEPERLGADEAAAEDVVGVAAHRHHLPSLGLDLEPAGRLAERTGAVVRGHGEQRTGVSDPSARSRARARRRGSGRLSRRGRSRPRACALPPRAATTAACAARRPAPGSRAGR